MEGVYRRGFLYLIGFSAAVYFIVNGIVALEGDVSQQIQLMADGKLNPYRDFNHWINSLFFDFFKLNHVAEMVIEKFGAENGYYVNSYIRDFCLGTAVYWISGAIWHVFIYHIFAKQLFIDKGRPFPSNAIIMEHMVVAQSAVFVYAAVPVVSQYLIENNYTKTYFYVGEVGKWNYVIHLIFYIICFEIGVYWMHRLEHESKFLYKYVHGLHHKYNTHETLSPWSSIAFNPLDGVLQASPYVYCLFFCPCHYLTHLVLLFLTGVWATNIHDALWGDTEPLMGSKYHTMHHTHYHYNFGQYLIFADMIFGSFKEPEKTKMD